MKELMQVTDVSPLKGYWIRVTFSDGAVKDIGLEDVFAGGGVFAPIRDDRKIFEQVRVNPEFGVVEWPGEIDLDSDVLYGPFEPASGDRVERRLVKAPTLSAA
jgi:hypothetical protein